MPFVPNPGAIELVLAHVPNSDLKNIPGIDACPNAAIFADCKVALLITRLILLILSLITV